MDLIKKLLKEKAIQKPEAKKIEREAKEKNKKQEEIILEKGLVPEGFLFQTKSDLLGIPLKKVVPEDIPLKVLKLIPESSVVRYKMMPLGKKDNKIMIGMVYPQDPQSKEAIRFVARQGKFDYEIFLIAPSDFKDLLKQYRTLKREAEKALKAIKAGEGEEESKETTAQEKIAKGKELAEEAPIVKMVSVVIKHAVEGKASDVHIEPTKDKLRIRYRLNGVLHPSLLLPMRVHSAVVARIKILSKLKIDETRVPQGGRFTKTINDKDIDFRVSTLPTVFGEKVVMRVLDPTEGLKTHKDLGLKGRNFDVLEDAAKKPFGLILATGPTGCGKTTTLYSILRLLNKPEVNIVTLEDPVEYTLEGVNQSQVKPEIGYKFSEGLREILRQDPDIVMVGEIRDEETAHLAIHASLTGHLVLSTLHTNNAPGVIPRMMDMDVRSFLLPSTLSIALAQRLVRQLCPDCKKKVKPNKKTKDYIMKNLESLPPKIKKKVKIPKTLHIYKPEGCEKCSFKGFKGRTGLFEILKMTDDLSKIILEKNLSSAKVNEEAKRQGMITMEQDGILKVLDGETTIEEVMRVAWGR